MIFLFRRQVENKISRGGSQGKRFYCGDEKEKGRERDWGRGIFVSGVDRKDWKKNLPFAFVFSIYCSLVWVWEREEGVWQSKSAETHLVGVLLWDAWYIWVYDRVCVRLWAPAVVLTKSLTILIKWNSTDDPILKSLIFLPFLFGHEPTFHQFNLCTHTIFYHFL